MNAYPDRTDDDLLDRAAAALHDAPVPAGPSDALQSSTLVSLQSRSLAPKPGILAAGPRYRLAAAVAALAIGAAASVALVRLYRPATQAALPHPAPIPDGRRGEHQTPGDAPTVPPPGVEAGALAVVGRIRFEGTPPPRRPINFSLNRVCAITHTKPAYDDSLLVNEDATVRNVVVSVAAGLPADHEFNPPAAPVVLDQADCFYQPHVVAMMTRQKIVVKNSDPFLHNVRSTATENERFNIAQYSQKDTTPLKAPVVPEVFQVRCDVHPWMSSWFCVFDHPYFAVTGGDGAYALRGLPPGRYTVRAWHERLGAQEREIVVKAGEPTAIDFTFRQGETASAELGLAASRTAARIVHVARGEVCPSCGTGARQ